MIPAAIARTAASILRGLSELLLIVGEAANPLLRAARWCDERARAWDPRPLGEEDDR